MNTDVIQTTRFEADGHVILHGDVLENLNRMDPESVDLVFADPPYNIGKDFDGLKENWTESEFLDWSFKWITACHRVLKPFGTFYLMNSTENMPHLDLKCRTLFAVKSRIVWYYDSSGVQAKRYFGSMYEPMLMLTKHADKYTFNYKEIRIEARTGARRRLIDYRRDPPRPYNTLKVPGNVWTFPRVRFRMKEYENHPTQKPEALLDRIVRVSSNPGDTVLDPFAGSFTTCAVARKLGRRSIGIEINEDYIKMGIRRLGLPSSYSVEELAKEKRRKTNHRSKKIR